MADGLYPQIPATPRSPLALTKAELDAGRAKALALWNASETDVESGDPLAQAASSAALSDVQGGRVDVCMVEDAAYAFAIIAAAARIDSRNVNLRAAGVTGDLAQGVARALPAALQLVRDYAKWVSETKTRMAAVHLGL